MPPADLIEQLLPATAYAYELRGPRRQQAWENLKKMRGLVRRIQNRGYATLARIADHIDSLTAGDESNAVIEALDAVNLMTVHASKGLEFPIVFVVNLARGASGPPRPVRVIVDGEGGEPSVSVGPFVSETDEAERDREKQETRRLMYVALTRARDRLYLSSVLKDGVLAPGRGSLAEVLPESLRQLFGRAATAFDEYDGARMGRASPAIRSSGASAGSRRLWVPHRDRCPGPWPRASRRQFRVRCPTGPDRCASRSRSGWPAAGAYWTVSYTLQVATPAGDPGYPRPDGRDPRSQALPVRARAPKRGRWRTRRPTP